MARSDAPGAGSVEPADHPPIPFSDSSWSYFTERLQALAIPLADSASLRQGLEAVYGHLKGVNAWLNLTRVEDDRGYLQRHVLDSLMLLTVPWFRDAEALRCCDLGSGGGYPGVPLAFTAPNHQWLLVDSRQRKVRFLAAAGALVDAERVRARAFRGGETASTAPEEAKAYGLVTTRATGSVWDISSEAQPLLKRGGRLVVWQGPSFDHAEEEKLRKALKKSQWHHIETHRYTLDDDDPQRCLITLTLGSKLW